jgi:hypothetical protein
VARFTAALSGAGAYSIRLLGGYGFSRPLRRGPLHSLAPVVSLIIFERKPGGQVKRWSMIVPQAVV